VKYENEKKEKYSNAEKASDNGYENISMPSHEQSIIDAYQYGERRGEN